MSKRSDFPRRAASFYPTPRDAFVPLLAHLPKKMRWIEPCAGDGRLVKWLNELGHDCVGAYDIQPAILPWVRIDKKDARGLLSADVSGAEWCITNPPWPEPFARGEPTLSIIRRMLDLELWGWFLLPADFMHNVYSSTLIGGHCRHIVSIGRVKWIDGTRDKSKANVCWYHFDPRGDYGACVFTPNKV